MKRKMGGADGVTKGPHPCHTAGLALSLMSGVQRQFELLVSDANSQDGALLSLSLLRVPLVAEAKGSGRNVRLATIPGFSPIAVLDRLASAEGGGSSELELEVNVYFVP